MSSAPPTGSSALMPRLRPAADVADPHDGDCVWDRCALNRHLDRILAAQSDGGGGRLWPLREVILRADPTASRLWLDCWVTQATVG